MLKIKKIISSVNGQKIGIDFSEINSEVKSEIKDVTNQLSKLKYDIKYGSKSFRSALIFYSYPTDLNGLYEVDLVVPVIGQYDLAVFGAELCEPDCEAHPDTIKIISQLNESYGTEVFGYVPIGCLTPEEDPEIDVSNLTIDEIKTRILSWKEMGARGVFLDEFGYDYRTTRERQNEIVDFCHENSLHVIVNAWEVDHVFGTENYIVEAGNTEKHPGNPNNLECHLTEDDYVFFEHLMFYATSNKKVTAEAPWNVYRVQEYYEKYYKKFKTQVFIANQIPSKATEDVQKELIRCTEIAGAVMQADVVSVSSEFWSSESTKTFYVEPFEIDGIKSRFIDVSYKGNENTGYPIKFKSVIGSREFELIWNAKNEDDEVYSSTKNYAQVNSNRNYPLNVSADKLIYQDYEITAKHNFKNGINLNGVTLNGNTDGALKFQDKNIVRSVNNVPADENGNVLLGTEKSTFNKVVYDTGYFSITTAKTYSFDLTGSDLENVSKENVNVRLVAKVVTAHNGFEVGDIAQLTTAVDHAYTSGDLDICSYIRGNTLYVYSGNNSFLSIRNGSNFLQKANVQIKAVLTAFVPDDGSILLIAEDQNNTSKLIGQPDGTLTWGGKNIVRSVNGVNADTDGNVNITAITVTEKYDDGNGNGYRVYSDGYCEQYGLTAQETFGNASNRTITLFKAYKNSNYNLLVDINVSKSNGTAGSTTAFVYSPSTSNFVIVTHNENNYSAQGQFLWRTFGYIS